MPVEPDAPVDLLKVLVVEDHPIMAEALSERLAKTGRLQVVGVTVDIEDSRDVYRRTQPDLVLCDIRLKHGDGIELVGTLINEWPAARILMFTGSDDAATAHQALDAGAVGFVRKSTPANDFIDCVNAVLAGERDVFDRATATSLWRAARDAAPLAPSAARDADTLTNREHEIIILMAADGLTGTAEISARLFISANTVRAHMTSIFTKLDVNSRARVVQYAFATGMVTR